MLDEESGDHRSNYVCNHKAFGFSTFLLYQGFISLVDIFSPKLHLAEEGITSLTKQNSLISLNTGFLEKCCPYSASKACVWGFWQDLCRLHKPKKKNPPFAHGVWIIAEGRWLCSPSCFTSWGHDHTSWSGPSFRAAVYYSVPKSLLIILALKHAQQLKHKSLVEGQFMGNIMYMSSLCPLSLQFKDFLKLHRLGSALISKSASFLWLHLSPFSTDDGIQQTDQY